MHGHDAQVVGRATQRLGCTLGRYPGLASPSTIICDHGPGGNVGNQPPY